MAETHSLQSKLPSPSTDFHQLAFGLPDDHLPFAQTLCAKVQARLEKKAYNRGLGLNEDGTTLERRLTEHLKPGQVLLSSTQDSGNESDWGLEETTMTNRRRKRSIMDRMSLRTQEGDRELEVQSGGCLGCFGGLGGRRKRQH